eukprot:c43291_g1_i1 orf=445-2472(+)
MGVPMFSSSSSMLSVGQTPTFTYLMKRMWQSRWLVLAVSLWLQACAGVGYAFGSYSPLVKSKLGYSQQQITILGIAKDLGASIGIIAGSLNDIIPTWCLVAIGALHNLIGYGWVWLIVTDRASVLPIWAVCILIFIGTNGEVYFNTATLVTSVRNFPKSRGHVVGLLKGFSGLCSAIFSQIYETFFSSNQSSYVAIVALGPTIVAFLVMFIIRPIKAKIRAEEALSEWMGFAFIYGVCGILAAYLMGVLILQDLITVSYKVSLMITLILLAMVALPLATPVVSWVVRRRLQEEEKKSYEGVNEATNAPTGVDEEGTVFEALLSRSPMEDIADAPSHEAGVAQSMSEICFTSSDLGHPQFGSGNVAVSLEGSVGMSELEDEKPADIDLLPETERESIISKIHKMIVLTAAAGAVRVEREKRPHRGEDFTLCQALVKADFWLLFWVLLCGAGTGMAAIDNMGQISESQGYSNSNVFVSLTSIFNFVGRLIGGYFSEMLVRRYGLPRSWSLAVAQAMMAAGFFTIAIGWPGMLYVGTLLVGSGYGAHWGIVPPIISELFGLKHFGMLYNVYTMATPAGALFFSGFLAGYLYDVEAAKQSTLTSTLASIPAVSSPHHILSMGALFASTSTSCSGTVCFRLAFLVMACVCIVVMLLTIILSVRTRSVYKTLYDSKSTSPP